MEPFSLQCFSELKEMLRWAVGADGPVAVRYPRGGEGRQHIKKPLSPCGGELLQARALRHSGGNSAQAAVLPGHLHPQGTTGSKRATVRCWSMFPADSGSTG